MKKEQTRHYYSTTTTTTAARRCDKRKLDSWDGDQQPFARDAAVERDLGGCVWPPRSYSCNFCGREFMSAQALGGHMNVHRRERARLKHWPSSRSPFSDDGDDDDDVNKEKKKKNCSSGRVVEESLKMKTNTNNLMFGCNKPGNDEKVCCLVDRCLHVRPLQPQPADGGRIMEELDLELRLGNNIILPR